MDTEVNKSFYFEGTDLSSHMEDYIEQIAILAKEKKVVRVKDIAKGLNKKMPSVTSALNKLMNKGLVYYEKYGYVELTEEGEKLADRVCSRHSFLSDIFTSLLRMSRKKAEENACRIEHFLSPEACIQLYRLLLFYKSEVKLNQEWTNRLKEFLEIRALNELKEGDSGELVKINGNGPFKKRLQEMGFHKGEIIKVLQYAPLKDPLKLVIKDYNISLRVEEAKQIIVKPLNMEHDTDER